jgi:hypothetical protein
MVLGPAVVRQVKGDDAVVQRGKGGRGALGKALRVGDVRVAGVETDAQEGRVKMLDKGPHVGAERPNVRGQHILEGELDASTLGGGEKRFQAGIELLCAAVDFVLGTAAPARVDYQAACASQGCPR